MTVTPTIPSGTSSNGSVTTAHQSSRFSGAHLHWPIDRSSRTFIVRVIEPSRYEPSSHGALFSAVMNELMGSKAEQIDPHGPSSLPLELERFDLITFPEAFVPVNTLVDVLSVLRAYGPSGCIHVGLRPSEDPENHLFKVDELKTLVGRLAMLDDNISEDMSGFSEWLNRQTSDLLFNVGCLLAVDSEQHLRVCLHPKVVRSQFETAQLAEHHMHEANFLALVTLYPADKQYFSITLQPLICSDALELKTDQPDGSPMKAVNRFADCFGPYPPDHIDVVSLATCTPQPQGRSNDGSPYREWHEQFQDTFRNTQTADFPRHHFSAIILANFRTLMRGLNGGLSGVFLPVPPKYKKFPSEITVSCWGKPDQTTINNSWSRPDDNALEKWKSRGFIAALNPFPDSQDVIVKIFGFTIQRLPRDISLWTKHESLTQCEVRVGKVMQNGEIQFVKWNIEHDQ